MLASLQLSGFRACADATPLALGRLSVLAGANNTGKSSFIGALLALVQSQQAASRHRLLLKGEWVDLGAFDELLSPDYQTFSIAVEGRIDGDELSVVWDFDEVPDRRDRPEARVTKIDATLGDEKFECQVELTASSEGSTINVLLEAEQQMGGQLIVLQSAKRSAEAWTLDCRASELHRTLLGFETYAAALGERGPDGERLSREECAARYHQRTTIPMSEESAATWKNPARRQRRMFIAGSYGKQYFDMHAKPGNMTRVHVWTPPIDSSVSPTPIYVGYCGKHLD